MKAWETSATVEQEGQICVAGAPFAPGTEVDVTVSPRRRPAEEFAAAWQRVCRELRNASGPSEISEDEIQNEVDAFRAGQ
jgi:hypothetical protein